MFCSNCGKKNESDAKYCIHCGNDLTKNKSIIHTNDDLNNSSIEKNNFYSKISKFARWFLGFILIILVGFVQTNPFSILLGITILPLEYKMISKNIRIVIGIISFFGIGMWAGIQATPNNTHQQEKNNNNLSTIEKTASSTISSLPTTEKTINVTTSNNNQIENTIKNEENKKNAEMLLKKVKKTIDDVEDRIMYESLNSVENHRDDCYLKLIQSKNTKQCKLIWYIDYYNTNTPLFIRYFTVKADDFKEQVSIPLMDINHELFMEKIVLSYENNKEVINAIANSKNTTIRFQGMHYYDDRKLSSAKINAIKDMLSLYQLCIDGYLQ